MQNQMFLKVDLITAQDYWHIMFMLIVLTIMLCTKTKREKVLP